MLDKILSGTPIAQETDIPVIIVSHSGYMKHNLVCGSEQPKGYGRKPNNNEVWVQRYSMTLGAQDAQLEPTALPNLLTSCRTLEDLVERPGPGDTKKFFSTVPEFLCEEDVKSSCGNNNYPQAWVDFSKAQNKC